MTLDRDDVIDLTGQLCALSKAGLGPGASWPVLAAGTGSAAGVAGTVSGMIAVGGTAAAGLRLAADTVDGPGREALGWLALTIDISERAGAPAAVVIDEVGEALLAELARAGERDVAVAGPRATATMLAAMPVVGAGLGLCLGVNTPAVLLGSPSGRVCLAVAVVLWAAGRRWSLQLIRAAERAGH